MTENVTRTSRVQKTRPRTLTRGPKSYLSAHRDPKKKSNKLNLSLIFFPEIQAGRRGGGGGGGRGSFVLEIQTGGGSCASENPGGGGGWVKKQLHLSGEGGGFFLE